MKTLLSLFSSFIFLLNLYAQPQFQSWTPPSATSVYHTHGADTPFPAIRISEDFGPRQLGADLCDLTLTTAKSQINTSIYLPSRKAHIYFLKQKPN